MFKIKKRRRNQPESNLQSSFITWLTLQYPNISKLAFSIPNAGNRHISYNVRLKKEGMKSGIPDLMICVANDLYHGLFIEFKIGKNKLSEAQATIKQLLEKENYKVSVCYTLEEAINTAIEYFGSPSKFRISKVDKPLLSLVLPETIEKQLQNPMSN